MTFIDVSPRKINFLMYLETCLVDYAGFVDGRRINKEEVDWAKEWTKMGFISFGRVRYAEIKGNNTHWVRFTNEAWKLAHKYRRARSERMIIKVNNK